MSTSKTAKEFGIPLKTVEKWITTYNKNPKAYNVAKLTDAERLKELEDEAYQKDYKKIMLKSGRKSKLKY